MSTTNLWLRAPQIHGIVCAMDTPKIISELQRHKGSWPFLARLFGVHYKTLQRFADGTTRNPRYRTVQAIVAGLERIKTDRKSDE